MTDEEKARMDALSRQAEKVGLSLRKSGPYDGIYYLAKKEHLSGEERRVGLDMTLDDVAGFLTEETAVRAALLPTYWLAEISGNFRSLYECDTASVIVEVVEKDGDAPELAYEQASRFVETKYGGTASVPARKPYAIPAQKPDRSPDGHSPEPPSCPVWEIK